MKVCIVNFARGDWYPRGQTRLLDTARRNGFDGDFLVYQDEMQICCPRHEQVPYAFKVYAIDTAAEKGYDVIFYFDASVFVVKPLQPLIDHVVKEGYFFQSNGHIAGVWCKDSALASLGTTRERMMSIPSFSAGCIGLDLRHARSKEFLKEWMAYAVEGSTFTGSWTNDRQEVSVDPRVRGHRHDQAAASVIADRLGMRPLPDRTFMAYVGDAYSAPPESAVLHLCPA
jgi:hypothetical protein